ncbi:MAG: hypothetical protein ACK4NX_03300 [Candidatus Paceibacteria bacterium]
MIIPSILYFSVFSVHFSLLNKPGPGLAFHPADFQNFNQFKKFLGLNVELYQSNARLTASHPYSSKWYEWPFMTRPVYYWNSLSAEASGKVGRIYFFGNPLIYWLSTLSVIYAAIYAATHTLSPPKLNFKSIWIINSTYFLLLISYFLNLFPFIFIGRVMFLYHYLNALIFAVLILCFQLDRLCRNYPKIERFNFATGKTAFRAILISAIALFLFFSPLTYGLIIPKWYYNLMVWSPSWR